MKKYTQLLRLTILAGCVCIALSGCDTGGEDPTKKEGEFTVSITKDDGTVYYSLSTGQKVTDPANKNWDIAFRRDRLILTNSGDTASDLSSGGQGGVWYTGKDTFEGVTADTKEAGPAETGATFNTDKKAYIKTMAAAEVTLNVMSYVGYGKGTGTNESPYEEYKYNAQQYYKSGATMGQYASFDPGRVYLIRHGDGTHYSKIQIEYQYTAEVKGENPTPARDNFVISYVNLN